MTTKKDQSFSYHEKMVMFYPIIEQFHNDPIVNSVAERFGKGEIPSLTDALFEMVRQLSKAKSKTVNDLIKSARPGTIIEK